MASLRTLINSKVSGASSAEENLERGLVTTFTPTWEFTAGQMPFCWKSPGSGTVTVEIWGASGSGARMCCCGAGLPGNPGAYSKKTFSVNASSYICGLVGLSCGNGGTLCFRGCSQATEICWVGSSSNGCMCAQGGRGGTSFCQTGSSSYCCFAANSFCATFYNTQCGIVCNFGPATASCCAEAYGGDVNRRGGFSCASFLGCYSECICYHQYHVAVSPGVIAQCGAVITYGTENNSDMSMWSGQGHHQMIYSLNAARRTPAMGSPFVACWNGQQACGCYEIHGCLPYMPYGVPGLPAMPCGEVRDSGIRGGPGAVRIKFL